MKCVFATKNDRGGFTLPDGTHVPHAADLPIGAMWFAPWFVEHPEFSGTDGRTLVVKLPGNHDWIVDARASNCDSPCANCSRPYHAHRSKSACAEYKDARPHKCWIRHGEPPAVTVDKVGVTCNAGAGSIQTGSWHGFLRDGMLVSC